MCGLFHTEWQEWSNWGRCSKSCGGGEQTRDRRCYGYGCQGDSEETRACNTKPCKNIFYYYCFYNLIFVIPLMSRLQAMKEL